MPGGTTVVLADEDRLSGPAGHMAFVNSGEELLVAVARSQGIEVRRVNDTSVVDVIEPELTFSSVLGVPSGEGEEELLVAGGPDGVLRVYRLGRHREQVAERRIGPGIQDLAYARDTDGDEIIAVMHRDGITLWHRRREELTLIAHPREAGRGTGFKLCLYHAFGALWLAGAYSDDSLLVWRLDAIGDGTPVARLPQVHRGQVWTLITIDGPGSDYVVASGSADGTARMWRADLTNGLVQGRILHGGSTIRRLGRVSDSDVPLLVTATASGVVALWRFDGETDRPMREITQHLGEVWSLACAATLDGGIVIASGDMHGVVQVAKLRTDVISDLTAVDVYQAQGTVWAATSGVLADGTYLGFAGVDQMAHVIDPASEGAAGVHMHGHVSTIRSLTSAGNALDPHLISGGADRRVLDWDPVTGELKRELPVSHQGEVWALATFVLRGAQYVASGSADGTVRICRLAEGQGRVLVGDLGAVNALVATPEGDDTLLTVASTRGVRIVSALRGQIVAQVSTFPVAAACAVFDGTRHLVITARADGDTCVIDVIDPSSRSLTSTFRYTYSSTQVSAVAAARLGDDVLIFGGCEDGRILVWQIDGTLVGHPAQCGSSVVRSMGIMDVGFAALTSGPTVSVPSLYAVNDNGLVRVFPIAAGSLLRSGGSVGAGVKPATILLQDQPTERDTLSRNELVKTVHDVLMAGGTQPPVVIGVHAPWGQGKSSVLRQLRKRLDPSRAEAGDSELRAEDLKPTHTLVPTDPLPGRWKRWRQGGDVRTRLTRAWAWQQVQKPSDGVKSLGYEMRPAEGERDHAITVWFNPWMYETPEQVWAGLTREIVTGISDRLPRPQRERLWFDLNLRRTDPSSMRKRILASYIPRSLLGMIVALLAAIVAVVAVSAMAVTAVQTLNLAALIGSSAVIILTVLGFLGNLTLSSFKQVRGWIAPSVLTRPTVQGVTSAGSDEKTDWRATRDPMESSQRGYLYMLQHDVGELLDLAGKYTPIVILVDDLDRCGPHIVADTVEAVNLFLSKAFGPCHFVIALDPATVAAQLETVYASIRARAGDDPSSFGHLQHTGWRFMEKILDLPIRLPRVRDAVITTYLDELLDATGPAAPPVVPVRISVPPAAQTSGSGVNIDTASESITVSSLEDSGVQLAEYLESLLPVRRALRTAVLALPARNPRQTKAFVNLWRFYMVLDYRTGYLSSSLSVIERHSIEMARFIEVMVRWPWLLDALGAQRGEDAATRRTILAELLDACTDNDRWRTAVMVAGLDPDDPAMMGLRNLFRRPGTDSDAFASIAVRYL
jgi:WD40 repeat protein